MKKTILATNLILTNDVTKALCLVRLRSDDFTMTKIPSICRNPSKADIEVWCSLVVNVIGKNEKKIMEMKASPREEVKKRERRCHR